MPIKGPIEKCYFSPGRDAETHVVGFVDRATKTLDVAIYALTSDNVADALVRAAGRGVKVRAVMDRSQAGGRWSDDEKLVAAGIEVRLSKGDAIMHNKFAVCDHGTAQRALLTGSYNFTVSAATRNAENFILSRLKGTVDAYSAEFERLWTLNSPTVPGQD